MNWSGKIGALILTYNRKEILARCLAAVMSQVEPPDAILVLDNGSTDGTADYIRQSGLLDDGRVVLFRLPENLGPAGGIDVLFRLGMERGYDWFWFLDDDSIPDGDALYELKRAYAENFSRPEDVGFLRSIIVCPDGSPNSLPEVDLRAAPGQCPNWADRLGAGLVRVRWSTLNSMLLPRSTALRVGELSSDFYFAGEDIDFTFRITEVLPAYIVGKSRATHLCAASGFFSVLSETDPARIRMGRYYYRNNLYFRWHYYSIGRMLLYVAKCVYEAGLALQRRPHPVLRAASILGGVLSGIGFILTRPKTGKRPSPFEGRNRPIQVTAAPAPPPPPGRPDAMALLTPRPLSG